MLDYITASEAANKWGISHRRVIALCDEKRIENASRIGNMWIIPSDAEKPVDGRMLRYEKKYNAKPFVKWAGGKGQLLSTIKNYYPKELGKNINKYCEPMVGAGAVLFDILNNYNLEQIMICDTNKNLINTYQVIKNSFSQLAETLLEFQNKHLNVDDDGRKQFYYSQRDLFNELLESNSSDNVLKASLFIYLNKTCFNGLYRVNKNGGYNVPMGAYKNPKIYDFENLKVVSEKLLNVEIVSGDYSNTENFIDSNTFVYFDPPYRPLTKTASFVSYNENKFNDDEQKRLSEFIVAVSEKGAKILASNSDPKNVNEDDDFFDDLYCNFNISRVSASRSINSNGKNRGRINELLICNY